TMRFLLLLLSSLFIRAAWAKLRKFELHLSQGQVNPDCGGEFNRLLVNGQYPAPPLRVVKGDEVHVLVRNHDASNHTAAIHYHGIFQTGTMEADGMPNITQAEILPGAEYLHKFYVRDQIGTYFYHAHVGIQDETIYGPFIIYESEDAMPDEYDDNRNDKGVHDGPYKYDGERVVLLSEWWHQEEQARMDYILGTDYRGMRPADSYLINGRTVYNDTENCDGYSAIDVEQGKTYRLRVIGSLTFASLGFAVAHHTMTVIEVDGVYVKPYQVPYLEVSAGQRFSVLITADQAPESYYIDTKPLWLEPLAMTSNGRAILRYNYKDNDKKESHHHIHGSHRTRYPTMFTRTARSASNQDRVEFPAEQSEWYFPSLEPAEDPGRDFSAPADRTIVLMPRELRMPDNTTRWTINDHPVIEFTEPLIQTLSRLNHMSLNHTAIDRHRDRKGDGFDDATQTFPVHHGEVIDIVVHTTTIPKGICVGHPWHSHGYNHYVIASGAGRYNEEKHKDVRTYPHPIAKDTSFVYPVQPESQGGGVPCGWNKIRFYMDNPGLWAFHCHITGHMLQGMMTILQVEPKLAPALGRE
ncbi:Cupredoxin, partial [Syncephalastrum racemosum]